MRLGFGLFVFSGALGLAATVATAAPVLIDYASIAPDTVEDFEAFPSPSAFGATAGFDGFAVTASGGATQDLRIPTSLGLFCGAPTDNCLINADVFGLRLFDGFLPDTTAFGVEIFKINPADVLRVRVTGNSGVATFESNFAGPVGFSDPTGLISVSFENLGAPPSIAPSNYSFDDVITVASVAPIPLPSALPLLLGAFGAFGLWAGRKKPG